MPSHLSPRLLSFFLLLSAVPPLTAADKSGKPEAPRLAALNSYFEQQVSSLEGQLERDIKTKEDWLAKKDEYRRQLAEMLGLDPMPPRTDLHAAKTGEFEHEGIIVENLHYQAMPGLYVTANLYRPKVVEKPLPTVLYVCGHSLQVKDGISYGNKAHYEHHGVWYAKHGFVCLMIDTVELGEIRGEHHGTYSKGRFWWWSRGYTPAGCETWQGIRALDYLETRPEVDKKRFGVAGRSGGGAYSWYIAALDERIQCAAPTAGITTLRNHVVDGCVEGHCDCMFMVNTYRWDYDKVAVLVAPRPLCIVNTDKDRIFPIDGVFKIYQSARRIYTLLGAEKNIGLQVAEGPHQDSQPLNVGEFHWMTRFLQGADAMSTLDAPAVHSIPMEKLRVFASSPPGSGGRPSEPAGLPKDEKNTTIDEILVPMGLEVKVPQSGEEWARQRDAWLKAAKERSFAGWESSISGESFADHLRANIDFRSAKGKMEPDGGWFISYNFGSKARSYAFSSLRESDPKSHEQFFKAVVKEAFHEVEKLRASEFSADKDSAAKGYGQFVSLYWNVEVNRSNSNGLSVGKAMLVTPDAPAIDLVYVYRADLKPQDLELIVLNVLDEQGWQEFANTYAHKFPSLFPKDTKSIPDDQAFEQEKKMFENFKWGMAYICPRGIGPTTWDESGAGILPSPNGKQGQDALATKKTAAAEEKSRIQRLRRFYLLGQTLEGQQVWDIRCAIRALRSIEGLKDTKLWLQASRTQAANVLMASLFEENITRLDLHDLPHSLMPTKQGKAEHPINDGEPVYLNMLKYLDLPQAAAMAAERTRVVIYDDNKSAWNYPQQVSEKLGWGKEKKNGLQLRDVPKEK